MPRRHEATLSIDKIQDEYPNIPLDIKIQLKLSTLGFEFNLGDSIGFVIESQNRDKYYPLGKFIADRSVSTQEVRFIQIIGEEDE